MRVRITIEMDTVLSRRTFDRSVQEALLQPNDLFVPSNYGMVVHLTTELCGDTETVLSHDGVVKTRF